MKIRHRVPVREMKSDPISEEYQAEVDRSTGKLEREYARAQKRLAAAEAKAERVTARMSKQKKRHDGPTHQEQVAWAEVELRRSELAQIQRLMQPAGAAAKNRGRASYRPVPITHGIDL